ncbi:GNAT family N-acetyltransferase [Lysinibacillus capsici]|uniref:GNAT family N-acetyltransferase n=1 Tax=Lysinibacillus capsici TaxID=2115968 RepID=UPI000E209328|nr:GNAT family N-acetyltransferase [Lysinibacillus capsici]RDV28842.1 hypothetical protein C7B89_18215 [Lysinibacillus capsici]
MIFKIFDLSREDEWKKQLDLIPDQFKDIYYSPAYYKTWKEHEQAEPLCVYAEKEGVKLLYPFFKKEIQGYNLKEKYYDIQSAYGYGGVISNTKEISQTLLVDFNKKFDGWCKDSNIVAEFIRENPFLNNKEQYIRDVSYILVRKNVYADLTNKVDFDFINKNAYRNIKKALKYGLIVEIDSNCDNIEDFQRLYTKTFQRLNMSNFYNFQENYFQKLKPLLGNKVKLLNIRYEEGIIASIVLLEDSNKATYHLGASDFNYAKYFPNDLLFHTMIEYSIANNINYLSFGGGTTNDEQDSLLRFKRKYSNLEKDVYIGKKVHHTEIYQELCRLWEQQTSSKNNNKYKNFFLKYRMDK